MSKEQLFSCPIKAIEYASKFTNATSFQNESDGVNLLGCGYKNGEYVFRVYKTYDSDFTKKYMIRYPANN